MKLPRPYHPATDSCYHPDDTPELFLVEKQVKDVLRKIQKENSDVEQAACELLCHVETLHRQVCTGTFNADQAIEECQQIAEEFRDKYGIWHFHTVAYELFYSSFDR